ncbi:MAG: cell wall hydrolase [Lachnospiraceae bacterium]|nr:cell wall hydrolase [Lachnospiraceae bacterium]
MSKSAVRVTATVLKVAAVGTSAALSVFSCSDVRGKAEMRECSVSAGADERMTDGGTWTGEREKGAAEKRMTIIREAEEKTEREAVVAEDDGDCLMKVAMAEAEGETVEGKALVMLVVLNRVADPGFPDTVDGVIMQEKQFATVANGSYQSAEPDSGCKEALELVNSGWDESEGAEYFESCKNDSWHSRNRTLLFEFGGHRFYK